MPGYLYAVIFEQGTVKVGMTIGDAKVRVAHHASAGKK
jgi:hypothetical protein